MRKGLALLLLLGLVVGLLLVGCSSSQPTGYAAQNYNAPPPPPASGGGCGITAPADGGYTAQDAEVST